MLNRNFELKPCPFCGGDAQFIEEYRGMGGSELCFYVECKICKARTRSTGGVWDDEKMRQAPNKAVERWNRRT